MSTLDSPQFVFVCRVCGAREVDAIFCEHPPEDVGNERTLVYEDLRAYMTALSLAVHPLPSDADVWDYLATHIDMAPTNRQAVDNAIRAVAAIDASSAAVDSLACGRDEERWRSALRDGSPGPVRLANRASAKDGL